MATYYALNLALSEFRSRSSSSVIADTIKDGSLSFFLLKPYSVNLGFFAELIARMTFRSMAPITLLIVLSALLPTVFVGTSQFGYFLISLLMSILINYLFFALLGRAAFWTTNIWGVIALVKRLSDIFSGVVVPLDLFPPMLAKILSYLPFRYMVYSPIAVYQGRLTGISMLSELIIQLLWILFLITASSYVWCVGIKRYESVGN
jgi:ABC-2 type transport system permease protein